MYTSLLANRVEARPSQAVVERPLTLGRAKDFEGLMEEAMGETRRDPVRVAADWKKYEAIAGQLTEGLGFSGTGTYSDEAWGQLEEIDEQYKGLLEQFFPGMGVEPPVANYDPRIEMARLAEVQLKVEAMDAAGEIDEAVDAFIGIHGLKDRISKQERAELKDKFTKLAAASLLEQEWTKAYVGAVKDRLDLSFGGLNGYLLGEEEEPRRVVGEGTVSAGDPDLFGFLRDPKWTQFGVEPDAIAKKMEENQFEILRVFAEREKAAKAEALAAEQGAISTSRQV